MAGIGNLTDYAGGYGGRYIRATVGDTPALWHRTDETGWAMSPADAGSSSGTLTLSNNNLTLTGGNNTYARGVIGLPSGKWYWETRLDNITDTNNGCSAGAGLTQATWPASGFSWGAGNSLVCSRFAYTGTTPGNGSLLGPNGATASPVPVLAQGDVIGIAFDADNRTAAFYINNTLYLTKTSLPSGTWYPTGFVGGAGRITFRPNASQQSYAPPSGFIPLGP